MGASNVRVQGAALVHKIVSKSTYTKDTNNQRFDVIKDWHHKTIDERSTML